MGTPGEFSLKGLREQTFISGIEPVKERKTEQNKRSVTKNYRL